MNGQASDLRQDLVRRIQEASENRLRCIWRRADELFADQGGKLIYSIDYDVVQMFLQLGRATSVIGKIFSEDPDELESALSLELAEHILFAGIGKRWPVVVMPDLHKEIEEEVEFTLRWFAGRSSPEKSLARLRVELAQTLKEVRDQDLGAIPEEQKRRLYQRIARIFAPLHKVNGPAARLSRLRRLLAASPIRTLGKFAEGQCPRDDWKDQHDLLRRLAEAPRDTDASMLRRLERAWVEKLKRGRADVKRSDRNDAAALAYVEYANILGQSSNIRVVHITATQALFNVAGQRDTKQSWLRPHDGTFADRCLRHPTAYLAEQNVFVSDELFTSATFGPGQDLALPDGRSRYLRMLDMILARDMEWPGLSVEVLREIESADATSQSFSLDIRTSRLREVADRLQCLASPKPRQHSRPPHAPMSDYYGTSQTDMIDQLANSLLALDQEMGRQEPNRKNLLEQMNTRWQELCKGVVRRHNGQLDLREAKTLAIADDFVDTLDRKAAYLDPNDVDQLVEQLRHTYAENVRSAWNEYYEVTIPLGIVSATATNTNARGHAELIFVGRPECYDAIKNATDAMARREPVEIFFPKAVLEIDKIKPREYYFYLLLAVLFGRLQLWRRVSDLADQAISSVGDAWKEESSGGPLGREAFFMRAIAARMMAGKKDDLLGARQYLEAATRALNHEKLTANKEIQQNIRNSVTPIRFEAEEISIRVSEILFELYMEGGDHFFGKAETCLALAVSRFENARADEALVDKEFREYALTAENKRDRDRARGFAERRLLINIFNLALHLVEQGDAPERVKGMIEYVESSYENGTVITKRKGFTDVFETLRQKCIHAPEGGEIFLNKAIYLTARALLDTPADPKEKLNLIQDITSHFHEDKVSKNCLMPYDPKRFKIMEEVALQVLQGISITPRAMRGAYYQPPNL